MVKKEEKARLDTELENAMFEGLTEVFENSSADMAEIKGGFSWGSIEHAFHGLDNDISGAVHTAVNGLVSGADTSWAHVTSIADTTGHDIVTTADTAGAHITSIADTTGHDIVTMADTAGAHITSIADTTGHDIVTTADTAGAHITSITDTTGHDIVTTADTAGAHIETIADTAGHGIVIEAHRAGHVLGNILEDSGNQFDQQQGQGSSGAEQGSKGERFFGSWLGDYASQNANQVDGAPSAMAEEDE